MARPRLVVVDGPDVGAQFPVPERGGAVGRGEGGVVQLTDPSVSRVHFSVVPRDGQFVIVDASSRNRTLVNGEAVTEHVLVEGDVLEIGKTRIAYLPADGGVAVLSSAPDEAVTFELSAGELLAGRRGVHGTEDRLGDGEHRSLAALARLATSLRGGADRIAIARAACDALLDVLDADRAFVLMHDGVGHLEAIAFSGTEEAGGAQLSVSGDVLDRIVRGKKAVVVGDSSNAGRAAIAAPLDATAGDAVATGLLYADRASARGRGVWDEPDLALAACAALLIGAALVGAAARDALARENRALEERLGGSGELVGDGPAARALLALIAKVAPTDSTVLLLGESGSGKEMVAAAIHRGSRRAAGAFVCVNCAALSETLLESELFGHEKGAFTGAAERKLGRFELAERGTLFLDEVGELSLRCQTKFLRVLEERRFERVGGTRSLGADVRVIAATNRHLEAMVAAGEFRQDLYYRLCVITAEVPPLRERPEDVPRLATHFLERLRFSIGRRVTGFTAEAMEAMSRYRWPGNVRELRNAVERALVLGETELVGVGDLPPSIASRSGVGPANVARVGPTTETAALRAAPAKSLRQLEREGIIAALAASSGNKVHAAALLEIDRSTLYKKLKDYGIDG